MPDEIALRIGARIRKARTANGWTRAELGTRTDLGNTRIANWERGNGRPDLPQARTLAEALGVQAAWILCVDDNTPRSAISAAFAPPPAPVVPLRWRLSEVMLSRGIRRTADLHRRLEATGLQVSYRQVVRLVEEPPEYVNLATLNALMSVLQCEVSDLLRRDPGQG
jgi:transcriptional regulator with XRE-family HTH domain